MNPLETFGRTAKSLARNPLGIIALFIVLIYGFASLVLGFSSALQSGERLPIVWFIVVFPFFVLGVFGWLVSRHHTKLYAPSDFQGDEAFLQASESSLKAAFSMGAATAKWKIQNPAASASHGDLESSFKSAIKQIVKASRHGREKQTLKRLLWVDDHPENNNFERNALEALGVRVDLALSTDEALNKLSRFQYDALISDMGRPPDQRAGYTLLNSIRSQGNQVPFFIYSNSRAPERVAEAIEKGAQGATNRPGELFAMVLSALRLD